MTDTFIQSNIKSRFSNEESISYYTSIVYKLSPEKYINNDGITCIGSYCRCLEKNKCNCLQNIKTLFNK